MFSIAKDLSVKTEPVYLSKHVNDINNCFKFHIAKCYHLENLSYIHHNNWNYFFYI